MTPTIITAVCSRPPSQIFETKYGERRKAEFTTDKGEVIPIFADASDSVFSSIRKGLQVELVHGSKGYSVGRVGGQWSEPMPQSTPPQFLGEPPSYQQPRHPQQVKKERLEEVAEKGREAVRALAFFYREVQQNATFSQLSEEGQRQMAVTAFIQSQK